MTSAWGGADRRLRADRPERFDRIIRIRQDDPRQILLLKQDRPAEALEKSC
jgi:hypothetical protein